MKKIILIIILVSFSVPSIAANQVGRLGVGMANQLVTGMPTFSLKLQRNRASAIGGIFGLDSSSAGSHYALGLKYYRVIYEEPQLNFYSAFGGAMFNYKNANDATEQGYQFDGLFGTEFSFQGVESVGFSFEFGMGIYKYNEETHIATQGHNIVKSSVHFYL